MSARREERESLPTFCDTAEALLYFSADSNNPAQDDVKLPAFCRVVDGVEDSLDCLEHAVANELALAESDQRQRKPAERYVPQLLKDHLQARVDAWRRIRQKLATYDSLDERRRIRLENVIIRQLGGACDAAGGSMTGLIAPYRFCPKDSHDEMINLFCDPAMRNGFGMVYLGDREIILAKHRSYRETVQTCEDSEPHGFDLSYEPYVILVRKDNSDVLQHLQQRIYELFSDPGWARANYEAAFGNQRMSVPLAYLFLLNGVDPPAEYVTTDPLRDKKGWVPPR